MAPKCTPIYLVLIRPNFIMGGEREPILMNILFLVTLLFSCLIATSFMAAIFSTSLFSIVLWALRRMGKTDPKMLQVYLRYQIYQRYYPPRSTPFRIDQ